MESVPGILENSWRILREFRVCPSVYGSAEAVLSVMFVICDNIKYGAKIPKFSQYDNMGFTDGLRILVTHQLCHIPTFPFFG